MTDRRKEDEVIKSQSKADREKGKKKRKRERERQSGGMQGHLLSQDPSPGEELQYCLSACSQDYRRLKCGKGADRNFFYLRTFYENPRHI